jgi:hypothetical protein
MLDLLACQAMTRNVPFVGVVPQKSVDLHAVSVSVRHTSSYECVS